MSRRRERWRRHRGHRRGPWRRCRRWVGRRLHRRLFVWFGLAILLSGLAASLVFSVLVDRSPWREELVGAGRFVAARFAEVWDDAERREALARALSSELQVGVRLEDATGERLSRHGPACGHPRASWPVERGGETLGRMHLCVGEGHGAEGRPWAGVAALFAAGLVLWGLSGVVARHIARPLRRLVGVTRAIGEGKLDSRANLHRRRGDEVGELAASIDEMATRIERQMADQRELLAGVSHEIRTPLGHMRVLTDIARDRGAEAGVIDELDRELAEADQLVDQLLASSRLEFAALNPVSLEAVDVGRRALERTGLQAELLHVEGAGDIEADATLLGRALANLLSNADRHGGGATELRITGSPDAVSFEVLDRGPGLPAGDPARLFDSFYRADRTARTGASLGLGLALVRRIAKAHGGRVWARDREGGGARVGFEVPRTRET